MKNNFQKILMIKTKIKISNLLIWIQKKLNLMIKSFNKYNQVKLN